MEKIEELKINLEKKGYDVSLFENKCDATNFLNEQLNNKIIGIGGSQTVKEMGLYNVLVSHNTVYWHDEKPEGMSVAECRLVAAPLNAKRLNRKTPCAVNADKCYDCKSAERICRNFVVFKECPYGAKYHVILIKENLGY